MRDPSTSERERVQVNVENILKNHFIRFLDNGVKLAEQLALWDLPVE